MLVALIGNTQVLYLKNKYLEIYKDDKSIISATAVVIKGPSEGEYNYKYTVKARTGKYKNKKFIVYINKKNKKLLEYGDLIEIKGDYSAPEVARNYKGFDYSQYLKTLNKTFTYKEQFFIDKLIHNLNDIITTIKKQYKYTTLKDALYEKKIYVDKSNTMKITFMGIVDKILYEWKKKGINSKEDIEKNRNDFQNRKVESKPLFDYDWLNDNE